MEPAGSGIQRGWPGHCPKRSAQDGGNSRVTLATVTIWQFEDGSNAAQLAVMTITGNTFVMGVPKMYDAPGDT